MREILFRGKRKGDGEWIEGYFCPCCFGLFPCRPAIISKQEMDEGCWRPAEIIPETLGQFTGLSDRNGKRIFEGDIVYLQGIRFIVEFKGAEWVFSHIEGQPFAYPFFASHAKFCEILGNAHDNPDLLTKQKEET